MRLSLRAPYLILLVPFFAAAAATAADDGFIWIEGDTSKAVDVINIANDSDQRPGYPGNSHIQ